MSSTAGRSKSCNFWLEWRITQALFLMSNITDHWISLETLETWKTRHCPRRCCGAVLWFSGEKLSSSSLYVPHANMSLAILLGQNSSESAGNPVSKATIVEGKTCDVTNSLPLSRNVAHHPEKARGFLQIWLTAARSYKYTQRIAAHPKLLTFYHHGWLYSKGWKVDSRRDSTCKRLFKRWR